MNLNFNSPGVMWECQWQQEEVSPVSPVEDARVRAWTDGEKKGLSELRAGGGRDARKSAVLDESHLPGERTIGGVQGLGTLNNTFNEWRIINVEYYRKYPRFI